VHCTISCPNRANDVHVIRNSSTVRKGGLARCGCCNLFQVVSNQTPSTPAHILTAVVDKGDADNDSAGDNDDARINIDINNTPKTPP
jgi:hypothetical protein